MSALPHVGTGSSLYKRCLVGPAPSSTASAANADPPRGVLITDVPIGVVHITDVPIAEVPIADVPIADVPISDVHIAVVHIADVHIAD
eukprot:3667614-Pleurochrysis_carterae.AAC.1